MPSIWNYTRELCIFLHFPQIKLFNIQQRWLDYSKNENLAKIQSEKLHSQHVLIHIRVKTKREQ